MVMFVPGISMDVMLHKISRALLTSLLTFTVDGGYLEIELSLPVITFVEKVMSLEMTLDMSLTPSKYKCRGSINAVKFFRSIYNVWSVHVLSPSITIPKLGELKSISPISATIGGSDT